MSIDLLDHVQILLDRLDHIAGVTPRTTEDERAQTVLILRAVGEFVRPLLGPLHPVEISLFNSAAALQDLNHGVVADLLRPSPRKNKRGKQSGKKPDPSIVWLDRAAVCLAFHMHRSARMTQADAARRIAKQHKWVAEIVGPRAKGDPAGAIKNWDHHLRNGLSPVDAANAAYADGVVAWNKEFQSTKPTRAESIAPADKSLMAHEKLRRRKISEPRS